MREHNLYRAHGQSFHIMVLEQFLALSKYASRSGLFETVKVLYPSKGNVKAHPVWGSIDSLPILYRLGIAVEHFKNEARRAAFLKP